jgi:hypothetical protein
MARVRSIANPHQEGKHVTLAEARSAFREVSRDTTRYSLKGKLVTKAGRQRVGSKAKSTPKAQ